MDYKKIICKVSQNHLHIEGNAGVMKMKKAG